MRIELMNTCTLLAPAKINLYLEILGDRPDGFHELIMVMQTVSLADRITLTCQESGSIHITCNHDQVPCDSSNLAYRAAALMQQEFPDRASQYPGITIQIDKQIPVGAGLAGGSSNGAAVLVGLNQLWDLHLPIADLHRLAAQLGSDMPFSISGGTALATGRGEQLSDLAQLTGIPVVLAKYRSLAVSTPWAYKAYRQQFHDRYLSGSEAFAQRLQAVQTTPLFTAIAAANPAAIGSALHNDLEAVVLPDHPSVAELHQVMQSLQPLGTLMSGSGPTVFAIAANLAQAHHIQTALQEKLPYPDLEVWVAQFQSQGVERVANS